MNPIEIYVAVFAVLNLIVVGILLAEPGQSRTSTYGERWFGVLLSAASLTFLWWAA